MSYPDAQNKPTQDSAVERAFAGLDKAKEAFVSEIDDLFRDISVLTTRFNDVLRPDESDAEAPVPPTAADSRSLDEKRAAERSQVALAERVRRVEHFIDDRRRQLTEAREIVGDILRRCEL